MGAGTHPEWGCRTWLAHAPQAVHKNRPDWIRQSQMSPPLPWAGSGKSYKTRPAQSPLPGVQAWWQPLVNRSPPTPASTPVLGDAIVASDKKAEDGLVVNGPLDSDALIPVQKREKDRRQGHRRKI